MKYPSYPRSLAKWGWGKKAPLTHALLLLIHPSLSRILPTPFTYQRLTHPDAYNKNELIFTESQLWEKPSFNPHNNPMMYAFLF